MANTKTMWRVPCLWNVMTDMWAQGRQHVFGGTGAAVNRANEREFNVVAGVAVRHVGGSSCLLVHTVLLAIDAFEWIFILQLLDNAQCWAISIQICVHCSYCAWLCWYLEIMVLLWKRIVALCCFGVIFDRRKLCEAVSALLWRHDNFRWKDITLPAMLKQEK